MGHSHFSTLGFLIPDRSSVPVLLQPFHRGVPHHCLLLGWRSSVARRTSGHRPGVVCDCLPHLRDGLVIGLAHDASPSLLAPQPLHLVCSSLGRCRVVRVERRHTSPLAGAKLLWRCRYGARFDISDRRAALPGRVGVSLSTRSHFVVSSGGNVLPIR